MKLVCCDFYRGDSAAKQRDSGAWIRAVGEISLHIQQGVGLHVIAPVKSGWFASVMTAAEQRMSLLWDNTKLDQKTGRPKSPNSLTQGEYFVPRHLHYAGTPEAGKFISTYTHPFIPSLHPRSTEWLHTDKETNCRVANRFIHCTNPCINHVSGTSFSQLTGQGWGTVIFQSRSIIFIRFSSSSPEGKKSSNCMFLTWQVVLPI